MHRLHGVEKYQNLTRDKDEKVRLEILFFVINEACDYGDAGLTLFHTDYENLNKDFNLSTISRKFKHVYDKKRPSGSLVEIQLNQLSLHMLVWQRSKF